MIDSGSELGHAARLGDAPITLMIASDRPPVVDALMPRLTREGDFKVVGDPVADPGVLLACLAERPPRLLLLDAIFLDRLGTQATRLHAEFPGLNVLLLCDTVRPGLLEEIVANRFHGFVLADQLDASVKAIRKVAEGELWLPRALLVRAVYDHLLTPADRHAPNGAGPTAYTQVALTEREMQVVRHLRGGLSNKEIAQQLGVQEDTVKKHLRNVFRKIGIRRRAQLMM